VGCTTHDGAQLTPRVWYTAPELDDAPALARTARHGVLCAAGAASMPGLCWFAWVCCSLVSCDVASRACVRRRTNAGRSAGPPHLGWWRRCDVLSKTAARREADAATCGRTSHTHIHVTLSSNCSGAKGHSSLDAPPSPSQSHSRSSQQSDSARPACRACAREPACPVPAPAPQAGSQPAAAVATIGTARAVWLV
jgi:hypothetical protein